MLMQWESHIKPRERPWIWFSGSSGCSASMRISVWSPEQKVNKAAYNEITYNLSTGEADSCKSWGWLASLHGEFYASKRYKIKRTNRKSVWFLCWRHVPPLPAGLHYLYATVLKNYYAFNKSLLRSSHYHWVKFTKINGIRFCLSRSTLGPSEWDRGRKVAWPQYS